MMNLREQRSAYVARLDEGLERVVAQLRATLGGRRISVFGSYARGRRDLMTDLDLLVVLDTSRPVPERLAWLHGRLDARVDLDLIAWTPAEYDRIRARPFGRAIAAEERVLYEAGSDRGRPPPSRAGGVNRLSAPRAVAALPPTPLPGPREVPPRGSGP